MLRERKLNLKVILRGLRRGFEKVSDFDIESKK
jgi:hypothetical protein